MRHPRLRVSASPVATGHRKLAPQNVNVSTGFRRSVSLSQKQQERVNPPFAWLLSASSVTRACLSSSGEAPAFSAD